MRGEGRPQREDLLPTKVGSASIALWARHSLGAREAGVRQNVSNIIRSSIAILHK
jgi:hypothetical protein